MDIEKMKAAIIEVYPNNTWKHRVLYQMSDAQIVAVYYSFQRTGRFDKSKSKKTKGPKPVQISIFDLLENNN